MSYNKRNTTLFQNKTIQILTIPFALLIVWKLYNVYKSASKTAGDLADKIKNNVTGSAINAALKNNNLSPIRTTAITDIVENIYAAFYKDNFFGMGEDEEKAIENFNELQNISEVKAAVIIYKANFKKSLHADLLKYCNGEHFRALKTSLLNAAK